MKTLKIYTLIGTIALSMIFISCTEEETAGPVQQPSNSNSENLSSAEADFLISSVEKQKLHRDLYDVMAKKTQGQVFTDHSKIDAQYMEMLSAKVDKYSRNNPIDDKMAGEYENAQIQAIYDNFIDNNYDWEQMLLIAKNMEEMMIADVQQHLATVSGHTDIVQIYNDLINESQNQLEALNIELRSIGDTNI